MKQAYLDIARNYAARQGDRLEAGQAPASREPAPCSVAGCRFQGWSVELGAGVWGYFCTPHRRELYRRAIALRFAEASANLRAPVCCRLCGALVLPEDAPCPRCRARRSPLVQHALRLGAFALCACGARVGAPGDICEACLAGA